MTKRRQLVVVDGSNLATEGRATPSLKQLDESVRAFHDEHPELDVVVVVDATFGHRVAPAERDRVKQAELAGEIVTPPAGAVGRGDAFILKIAKRAGATVLSNDSFQEFQAEHPWLFEQGRLIGGKPVSRVGWIFTPRIPVRAQNSKNAKASKPARTTKVAKTATVVERVTKATVVKKVAKVASAPAAKKATKAVRAKQTTPSKAASSRAAPRRTRAAQTETKAKPPASPAKTPASKAPAKSPVAKRTPEPVNTARSFQRLLADSKVGGRVEGEVVQFTSHGAMVSVRVGRTMQVVCYAPLAGLGSPAPTRARDVLKKGDTYPFTIVAFDATRRRAELALAR